MFPTFECVKCGKAFETLDELAKHDCTKPIILNADRVQHCCSYCKDWSLRKKKCNKGANITNPDKQRCNFWVRY